MQFNILAEWGEGETGHLEVLFAEWDAYDSDTQEETEDDVAYPCPKTSEDKPEDIQGDADAAGRAVGITDFCTERPQAQQTYLEGLQCYWDAYDGYC